MKTLDRRHLLLNWLYPTRCGLCGLLDDAPICHTCLADFRDVHRTARLDVDRHLILYHYSGRAGQAVRRLKYSRATVLAGPMAERLAVGFERDFAGEVDAIVPVPLHWTRRFMRGFNQSELLCFQLPSDLVRPRLLRRVRATKPQSSLDPAARLVSLADAFRADSWVAGKTILLVDDVVTSGSTASECSRALRAAGAKSVSMLAFAGSP
ncbi:MAG TPA: phosphoribosyltransferase family protein [Fimbriimonadaceae bacterium]|nr:phosphoribosyltransferase family protein [Fimbriimonadaceae bacterium]